MSHVILENQESLVNKTLTHISMCIDKSGHPTVPDYSQSPVSDSDSDSEFSYSLL